MSDSAIESSLLIAMPQLDDPNFERAVVLMLHHDDDGAFGLVISRPTPITTGQLCETLEFDWHGDPEACIDSGGPVQPNTGWVLFGDGGSHELPESKRVADGLSFAGSIETLREIAADPPEHVRVFLGYSGWGPGQLEAELASGAWLLAPATAELIFEVPGPQVWNRVLADLGIDPATLVPTPGVH